MKGDRYKYFRVEARELVEAMTTSTLAVERAMAASGPARAPSDVDAAVRGAIAQVLRAAHTLKGAARVVKLNVIAAGAHALEEVWSPLRDAPSSVAASHIATSLRLIDDIAVVLGGLETGSAQADDRARRQAPAPEPNATTPNATAPSEPSAGLGDTFETVRVDIDEMDRVLDRIGEAAVRVRALRRHMDAFESAGRGGRLLVNQLESHLRRPVDPAPDEGRRSGARTLGLAREMVDALDRGRRELVGALDEAEVEILQVRDAAERLRLLPARLAFEPLARAVRDASRASGKSVVLDAQDGDVRLDAQVIATVREAFTHVARNAVVHGIETPAERLVAGKTPEGRVTLRVERRGDRVAFVCEDDGRGLDVAAIARAATARGVTLEGVTMTVEQAAELVLGGGFSTSDRVTDMSGRGIGLDAVRAAAAGLRGTLRLRSEPGRWTRVEMSVPVSLTSMSVLLVELLVPSVAGGGREPHTPAASDAGGAMIVAVPLHAVERTLRVDEGAIVRTGARRSIVVDGGVLPCAPLQTVLRLPISPGTRGERARSAVVVRSEEGRAVLLVDRLLGAAEVVVRRLPRASVAEPTVLGASIDAAGDPQLVLDPAGLVAATTEARAAEDVGVRRAPILVIDDSLTTRMLEKSILESAGYDVELAVSAEDGLARARAGLHSLFVVDVEMPGMNGYEFVRETKADPALRAVPSILVTSLEGPDDRRRGAEAGAAAYIAKGEFDQAALLRVIRELVG
jgi:two-component system chemotaxis sensor kinase CheA